VDLNVVVVVVACVKQEVDVVVAAAVDFAHAMVVLMVDTTVVLDVQQN
jgi:hypothetical protein